MAIVTRDGLLRLSDPSYQPLTARTAKVADEPQSSTPSLLELIAAGVLRPGDLVSPADPELDWLGEITEDGEILLDDHTYETPARAAQAIGVENVDSWEFWQIEADGPPRTLAALAARPNRLA